MASTALALHDPRSNRVALYGTRAQLAAASGDVEGYLTLAGCDKRAGTASYALRVDNKSAHALRARMTCLRLQGEIVPAYPLDVHVAPYSRCETLLPVRLDQVGRYDRAVVEVSGDGVQFTLEAPAPQGRTRKFPWLFTAGGALVLTIGASFAAASATPRIGMLAAPSRVFAGAPVEVPYAFGGWAAMQYALRTNDGRQLAAGLLNDHQGTLRFNVPSAAGGNVVLSVNVAGPFGRRESVQHISIAGVQSQRRANAAAKGPAQPPRISAFALTTPSVRAGGTASFAYATNAADGDIWLIDESGRLWAKAPIYADGTTTLDVPQASAGRQLRAVLRARTGSLDAVSSVSFTVLPGAVAPVDEKGNGAVVTQPAVMSLSKTAASPGETVTVTIDGSHGDATIALNDPAGSSLETGDIAEGQDTVALTAPSRAGTYYIVASVTEGVAQQTLVKKLLVK